MQSGLTKTSRLNKLVGTAALLAMSALTGCAGDSASSFSKMEEITTYKQSATFQPRKIDVLWVVDNSGS
ncbi:MAG: hypothetical protein V4736_12580, partial [Bdellovibrionota bacterium]